MQTKINAMLQGAGLEVGDWYVEAADDGQQMLQAAKEKNGYAFISRENWALYGEQLSGTGGVKSAPGGFGQISIIFWQNRGKRRMRHRGLQKSLRNG